MNSKNINAILEEMHDVDVSQLSERAAKLFNAIMQIADERDKLLCDKDNLIKYLEDEIKETKKAKEFTNKVIQESSAYESGLIDAYQDSLERLKSDKYE